VTLVVIEVVGAEPIQEQFFNMGKRASNLRPLFTLLTRDFRQLSVFNFDTQGALSGGWAELEDSTILKKQRLFRDWRILHEGGRGDGEGEELAPEFEHYVEVGNLRLRKSFTMGREMIRIPTNTSLTFESMVPYAGFHFTGFTNKGKAVPARPPFEFNPMTRRRWTKAMQRYIMRGRLHIEPIKRG
jgi:phage gpG-like protein